ncbi:hypothetical protein TNCV_3589301 [Trichonephila clavipes]|nr:hypothetical protein TNCV_3589301 [Trichonephila clavipes]
MLWEHEVGGSRKDIENTMPFLRGLDESYNPVRYSDSESWLASGKKNVYTDSVTTSVAPRTVTTEIIIVASLEVSTDKSMSMLLI